MSGVPSPQRVGGRWPAHASSSGKAILAFSRPPRWLPSVNGVLPRLTEHTITDVAALDAELERTRRRGVAYDRQESFPGVVGVAAPILGEDGAALGALALSAIVGRVDLRRMDAAVRTSALAVSRELARGHPLTPTAHM